MAGHLCRGRELRLFCTLRLFLVRCLYDIHSLRNVVQNLLPIRWLDEPYVHAAPVDHVICQPLFRVKLEISLLIQPSISVRIPSHGGDGDNL